MSHTHTMLLYHIVYSTKHREPWLTHDVRDRLYPYMAATAHEFKARNLLINGTDDHVHMLVSLPPNKDVSKFVQHVKANTSGWYHRTYRRPAFAWQKGFGAFTVSASQMGIVETYIRRQEAHHRKQPFQKEYLVLLDRHRIEYDLETVFD